MFEDRIQKLRNITEGWGNYIFPTQENEVIARERAKACTGCKYAVKSEILNVLVKDQIKEIQGYHCALCSCPLSGKTRSPEETCLAGRW